MKTRSSYNGNNEKRGEAGELVFHKLNGTWKRGKARGVSGGVRADFGESFPQWWRGNDDAKIMVVQSASW